MLMLVFGGTATAGATRTLCSMAMNGSQFGYGFGVSTNTGTTPLGVSSANRMQFTPCLHSSFPCLPPYPPLLLMLYAWVGLAPVMRVHSERKSPSASPVDGTGRVMAIAAEFWPSARVMSTEPPLGSS